MICMSTETTQETTVEKNINDSEDVPQNEETGPFPIPFDKFKNPGVQDQLRTLYQTLEQFYLISHRIKNP